jgi:uncharacterized membrane protein YedE/YeeE
MSAELGTRRQNDAGANAPSRTPDSRFVTLGILILCGGALALHAEFSAREALLFLLGGALGVVLLHASFGFSASWRRFVFFGESRGICAQMLMLALASAAFLPVLAEGSLFGQRVVGAVAPFGLSVAVGAFLFGLGMQWAGGCASGTLYALGGGSTRMIATLIFFMAGSLLGAAHLPWWLEHGPTLGSVSLGGILGWVPALSLQLFAFAAIAGLALRVEKRRVKEKPVIDTAPGSRPYRFVFGPWPLYVGAILLAILNIVTLALAGHPWTVSFGYTLWGAKLAAAGGLDVSTWQFWTWPFPKRALAGSVFENSTSLMNFGIIAGAFLAAALAGSFAPRIRVPWRSIIAAALGGLLMGYGARLAFGCNVGAYFSGIASGSLHGWLWFASALAGTYFGGLSRPLFGLSKG